MKHMHVIPVPNGMTPNEAWAEILVMGKLMTLGQRKARSCQWATMECDGEECQGVEWEHAES